MKKHISIYTAALALAAAAMWPADAGAQRINVLNISHGSEAASIKAEIVDADGKTPTSIVARTFHMPTGNSTTSTSCQILGGRYIVAQADYQSGNDYFYRLEVTFDDGTEAKTDCYNADFTQGAVWLSELPVTSANPANTTVGLDQCADGRPLQLHPTSTYGKGVSIFSPSEITIDTDCRNEHNAPFTSAKFDMGIQAFAPDGSNSNSFCRIIFKMNGAETGSKGNMKPYSNPTRGSAPYYYTRTEAANPIRNVGLKLYTASGATQTDADYGVLGACRLYYSVPPSDKQPQTITFDSPGGHIYSDSPEVRIGAYASGNTPVFFSIIQGADLATLDGNNILRPLPNKKGEIVVEAMTLGNDDYAPASATVSYRFNFGPTVEFADLYKDPSDSRNQTLYLHVEPCDRQLEKLQVEIYDDARSFTLVKTLDLLAEGLSGYATLQEHLYAIPCTNTSGADMVHRITYKFSGEEEVTTPLSEGAERYIYMSDIPGLKCVSGWASCSIDTGYGSNSGKRLETTLYTYGKGIGLHAAGYVETPASFSLEPFYRFAGDVGGAPISNSTRSARLSYTLHNGVSTPYLNTGNVPWQNVYEWDFRLQSTASGKTVKISAGDGGDGKTNDVVTFGALRLYYTPENHRQTQTISWHAEQVINNYKAFTRTLQATASSGLPVFYRILSGSEYARIVDGNTLSVATMPDDALVVVQAYQPGNKEYEPAPVTTCQFRLRKSVIVDSGERVELEGGHDVDELIIYGDGNSCGQVSVMDGIVNVHHLKLKYTFVPGQWNYIAFPSDMNLANVSDLVAKGFSYSTEEGVPGTFVMREYSTQQAAESPEESPWVAPASPMVKAMKGYVMKLESDDATPVEITFAMDNIGLDFENKMNNIYVSVNMRNCEPETRHTVYVRPANVNGNTLKVEMRYIPSDLSELPLNHARALESMRVTRTPRRGTIRLTLPDQTPARVAIFDQSGEHLLKAVNYISPMRIDVSDLEPGTYRMVVVYGPASREMLVEI